MNILDYLRPRSAEMLEAVGALVVHESPSRDKPALDALAGRLAGRFAAIGLDVERLPNPTGGDHLRTAPGRPGRRATAGAGPLPLRHGLAGRHAGEDAVPRRGRTRLRAGHLRHEGQPRAGGVRPPRPAFARDAAAAAGRRAVHVRRGDRQPDLARPDRGARRGRAPTCS